MLLDKSHLLSAGLTHGEIEAHFGGSVLPWLQSLLQKAEALGPAGLALAQKTVADVSAGNWLAVVGDVAALVNMLEASPA